MDSGDEFTVLPFVGEETSTRVLRSAISKTGESFAEMGPFSSEKDLWSLQMEHLLSQAGLTVDAFADLIQQATGTSYNTGRRWVSELPGGVKPGERRRENVIWIGLVLGLEIGELNRLLDRYARCRPLYMKNRLDAVCGLYLRNSPPKNNPEAVRTVQAWGELCRYFLEDDDVPDDGSEPVETRVFARQVYSVTDLEGLQRLFQSEREATEQRNVTLMRFLNKYLADTNQTVGSVASGEFYYLNKTMSSVRQGRLPARDDMLLFGILAGMCAGEIDELLRTAGMEELFPKNIAEAFILYTLEYRESDPGEYLFAASRDLPAELRGKLDETLIFSRLRRAYENRQDAVRYSLSMQPGISGENLDCLLAGSKTCTGSGSLQLSGAESVPADSVAVFAVSQGIAKGALGREAAELAVSRLRAIAAAYNRRKTNLTDRLLQQAALELNEAAVSFFSKRGYNPEGAGGATLTAAFIQNGELWLLSVGGKPVHLIRSGRVSVIGIAKPRGMSGYLGNPHATSALQADVLRGTLQPSDLIILSTRELSRNGVYSGPVELSAGALGELDGGSVLVLEFAPRRS